MPPAIIWGPQQFIFIFLESQSFQYQRQVYTGPFWIYIRWLFLRFVPNATVWFSVVVVVCVEVEVEAHDQEESGHVLRMYIVRRFSLGPFCFHVAFFIRYGISRGVLECPDSGFCVDAKRLVSASHQTF